MRRSGLVISIAAMSTLFIVDPSSAAPPDNTSQAVSEHGRKPVTTAINRQAERLRATAAANPEGAGGSYYDEAAGEMVVRYVNNADGQRLVTNARVLSLVADEAPVRFVATDTPIARLQDATAKLRSNRTWAGARQSRIHGVELDEVDGRIVVFAEENSDQIVAAAKEATGFAPEIRLSKGPRTEDNRLNDTGLLNGGMALWESSNSSIGAYCTAGFRMTRGGTNSNWMTTAGHCGTNGDVFWHNGRQVARISSDYQTLGTDVAMLAGLNGEVFSHNIWFGSSATSELRSVTAKDTAWAAIGSSVYISSANSGLIRGVIKGRSTTCGAANGWQTSWVDWDGDTAHTQGGDSGSPYVVYNSATSDTTDLRAVGTHSCGDGVNTAWMTHISSIEAAAGADVVVSGG